MFKIVENGMELLTTALDRVRYEVERLRKVGPTAARLGVSLLRDRLGEAYRKFQARRTTCDHTAVQRRAPKRHSGKGSVSKKAAAKRRLRSRDGKKTGGV